MEFKSIITSECFSANRKTTTAKCIMIIDFSNDSFGLRIHFKTTDMKYILLFVAFSFSFQLFAQENEDAKPKAKIFVRLYNHNNQKVGKGHLLYGNDSTIQLSLGRTIARFPVSEIETIKTKRAGGHNLLLGTAIGFGAGIAVVGLASVVEHGNGVASFDIAVVGLLLPVAGFAAGGVSEAFRKSQTFLINGNTAQWIASRDKILNHK